METIIINDIKELEKYKDDYGYKIEGNVQFNCSVDIDGRLLVSGFIEARYFIKARHYIDARHYIEAGYYIKAGHYIEAGTSIEAGTFIKAGTYIEAGKGIKAGLQIFCKGTLNAGLKIFAGVCTWKEISEEEKTISCSRMIGKGTIEYGILKETGEEEMTLEQICKELGRDVKIIK